MFENLKVRKSYFFSFYPFGGPSEMRHSPMEGQESGLPASASTIVPPPIEEANPSAEDAPADEDAPDSWYDDYHGVNGTPPSSPVPADEDAPAS
jgi:hypothetical protein